MRRHCRLGVGLLAAAATGWAGLARAAEPGCFLREGDVWEFHGDSITNADTYRRLCERVFRHYHPEAHVDFIQAGVWGSSSSDLGKRLKEQGRKPTVVSLMLGMNNAINGAWRKGMPLEKSLAAYRADIETFVRASKATGAAVILMSPTLADDTVRHTIFEIDGANAFLRDCGRIVKEVAAAEGVFYLPVQEEFESFQTGLDRFQRLRPDGVHPASCGEYRIACTLWERLNFSGKLGDGARTLSEPGPRLAVTLRPASPFAAPDASEIEFRVAALSSAAPATPAPPPRGGDIPLAGALNVAWSLGDRRGTGTIEAGPNPTWRLTDVPALAVGNAADAVIELRGGGRTALFVVDLCAVRVLHLTNDVVTGAIESGQDRAEGRHAADWRLSRSQGELLLQANVIDAEIRSGGDWAWGRDGLNLFWDLRPPERFAGINLDADFHQSLVNVYELPFVAAALRPWLGDGMEYAATASAERTATGYTARFRLHQGFGLHRPLALDQRDFVGLSVIVVDQDGGGKEPVRTAMYEAQPPVQAHDQYANNLMVLDLKNKLSGERVVNVSVWPPEAAAGR